MTQEQLAEQGSAQLQTWWAEQYPALLARWKSYLPEGWEPELVFTPKAVQLAVTHGGVRRPSPNEGDKALLLAALAAALTADLSAPHVVVLDGVLDPNYVFEAVCGLQDYPGNVVITSHAPPKAAAGNPRSSRFRGNFKYQFLGAEEGEPSDPA